jgi:hypothetical protein
MSTASAPELNNKKKSKSGKSCTLTLLSSPSSRVYVPPVHVPVLSDQVASALRQRHGISNSDAECPEDSAALAAGGLWPEDCDVLSAAFREFSRVRLPDARKVCVGERGGGGGGRGKERMEKEGEREKARTECTHECYLLHCTRSHTHARACTRTRIYARLDMEMITQVQLQSAQAARAMTNSALSDLKKRESRGE